MTVAKQPGGHVGTSSNIGTIAKYNFLNYFRARRFYVMIAIVALITGLLTVVIAYERPAGIVGGNATALGFFASTYGAFGGLVLVLSAAFFGGDAISSEFQNRTGYFLVPNPIRRSAIYVGKYIAALAASTIILLVYVAVFVLNSFYYFGPTLPSQLYGSLLFSWFYLVALLALAFAFSSMFRSSAISVLMTVIVILFVFNIVDFVSSAIAGIEPWFSLTYGGGIATDVLTVPFPAHKTTGFGGFGGGPGGGFGTTFHATVPEGLVILGVYFVVMVLVGLVLFEKKEFTS